MMQIKDAMVHDTLLIASPPAIDRELLTEYALLSSVCAFDAFHHAGCRHGARVQPLVRPSWRLMYHTLTPLYLTTRSSL